MLEAVALPVVLDADGLNAYAGALDSLSGRAAVLTPHDIVSQTCLAVPLIVLYEVSIISCRMVEKARAKREAEEEAELAGGGNPSAPGE